MSRSVQRTRSPPLRLGHNKISTSQPGIQQDLHLSARDTTRSPPLSPGHNKISISQPTHNKIPTSQPGTQQDLHLSAQHTTRSPPLSPGYKISTSQPEEDLVIKWVTLFNCLIDTVVSVHHVIKSSLLWN